MLRFAPSSTKALNINSLQEALINYIISKKLNETFFVSLYDFNSDNKNDETLELLKHFAIDTSNIIYQSQNLNFYKQFVKKLIDNKKAFYCFCKSKECSGSCLNLNIDTINKNLKEKKDFVVRINNKEFKYFAVFKNNNLPTNIFANAIDEIIYEIKYIATTNEKEFLQTKLIKELLGIKNMTKFIKLPNLGANIEILALLKEGFLPDSIINYILYKTINCDKKFFYLPDFIKKFDFEKIKKETSFKIDELKEFNKEHIKIMDNIKLSQIVGFADSNIGSLLKLLLKNRYSINQISKDFKTIFSKKECDNNLKKINKLIFDAPYFENFDDLTNYLVKNSAFSEDEIKKALKILILNGVDADIKEVYNLIKPYLLEVAQCQ
jgi:glutamyl-tRNA synthetase